MGSRQFILLLTSLFLVLIFFNMPGNKTWLDERVLNFLDKIHDEADMMTLEERRVYRLGAAYNASILIKQTIESWKMKDSPLVLLPPRNYVKSQGFDMAFPEPIVFYYYTGIKAVEPTSKNVLDANIGMVLEKGMLNVARLKNKESVQALVQIYNGTPKQ